MDGSTRAVSSGVLPTASRIALRMWVSWAAVKGFKAGNDGAQVAGAAVLGQQGDEVLGGLFELGLGRDGDQTLLLVLGGDDRRGGEATQVGALEPGSLQGLQIGAHGVELFSFESEVEQRLCVARSDFRRPEIVCQGSGPSGSACGFTTVRGERDSQGA